MQQDWIQRIEQNTSLYNEYFGSLTWENLNWKPNEESWSIGQIIDHVNKINEDYFDILEKLKADELKIPFIMNSEFLSNYFGNILLQTIEPERTKKTKTMKIWQPESQPISTNILDQFENNQRKFIQLINELEEQIESNTIIHSPLSKWITLPLNTAIEMLIQHELRHFNQAKELLGQIEKSIIPF